MQNGWSALLTFSVWLVGLLVSAALVIGFAILGLWVLDKTVGKTNYPALTMLLAVIGGLLALYQSSNSMNEKAAERARTLAYATNVAKKMMFSSQFFSTPGQKTEAHDQMPPEVIALKIFEFRESAKALSDVDIKNLPSALSMEALVRARAAANGLVDRAEQGLIAKKPVDFDQDVYQIGGAIADLEAEQTRLYPMYNLGPVMIGTIPQWR